MEDTRFLDIDNELNSTLRPQSFNEYIGQEKLKEAIKIYIEAAKKRNENLDHILLYGPPGLGKTTLAMVIANEMNTNIKITSGPVLDKAGDLASILTSLEDGDILFIDEIHRMSTNIEEMLYPAMEDGEIDIMLGKGPSAKSIRLELPKFTLIGATTNAGKLSRPLRDRFGVTYRMEFYTDKEIEIILKRGANILNLKYTDEAIKQLVTRTRHTPRLANRLLKRARDYAEIKGNGLLNVEVTDGLLHLLEIDKFGLDNTDRQILEVLSNSTVPIGLTNLSLILNEDRKTIEEVYEPFLISEGLIMRTHRGRIITNKGLEVLKKDNDV